MTSSRTVRTWRGILPQLSVDRSASTPLHRQVYDALRALIVSGNLRPDQLVPSTRDLARGLGISRITVLGAYSQLFAEGYLETRSGRGTFVSRSLPDQASPAPMGSAASVAPDSEPRRVGARASALVSSEAAPWVSGRGPFSLSQPALDEFPFRDWSETLSRYSRKLGVKELGYQDSMGLIEVREAIATYLRTARAVRCEAQQIMIVSGSQQALDLTTRVLLDARTPVWVEEPGYWLLHQALAAAGCRPVPVRVDAEGLDVAAGVKRCRNARAAFVTPSHQYPLGVTMSASRRLQLLEWAHSSGSWIVEDDYDSEYRYDNRPIASLQGLDRYSRVIYIGTFSKVLFPSLRLGYLVLPPDLVGHFKAVRHTMDICPSNASQAVVAEFIAEGHFARHVRKMRVLYGQRRAALCQALQGELGTDWEMVGAEAGMHLAVLGQGFSDLEVSMRAARSGLWLWPLSPAYLGDQARQGFILGFGNVPVAEMPAAVRAMKAVVEAGQKPPATVAGRSRKATSN